MFQKVGYNDVSLVASLLYFCVDLQQEWHTFSTCSRPIQQWLFGSCVCAIAFRLVRMLDFAGLAGDAVAGTRPIGGNLGELLPDLRVKGSVPRFLASFTSLVAVPFFALWTVVGTHWVHKVLTETPYCVKSSTYLWFSGAWLLLCYYWVLVHAALGVRAWRLRRRAQRTEGYLRDVEDEDVLRRWGHVSESLGSRTLSDVAALGGLSPDDIKALPCETMCSESMLGTRECPICIAEMETGDNLRCLPGCSHTFHRSCIDLWLVRRADCPLCKQSVTANAK